MPMNSLIRIEIEGNIFFGAHPLFFQNLPVEEKFTPNILGTPIRPLFGLEIHDIDQVENSEIKDQFFDACRKSMGGTDQ